MNPVLLMSVSLSFSLSVCLSLLLLYSGCIV